MIFRINAQNLKVRFKNPKNSSFLSCPTLGALGFVRFVGKIKGGPYPPRRFAARPPDEQFF